MDEQLLQTIEKMAESMTQLNELLPDLKEMRDSYKAEKLRREEEEREIEEEKYRAEDFIKSLREKEKVEEAHRARIKPLLC